jgi:short-subunit dehydrogenase
MVMKKAIVIGASSGIGRELAKVLAREGYEVGLIARRRDALLSLQKEIDGKTWVKQVDIVQLEPAMKEVKALIEEMGGVDLFVLNAGVNHFISGLDWEKEKEILNLNVLGFCAMAHVAMDHFFSRGKGHLVGISSISALRGIGMTAAYTGSKAFVSNYLQGLRQKSFHLRKTLTVTDVKPGFIDTRLMTKDISNWVASPQTAAEHIYRAIYKKKNHVYVTRRWRFVGWAIRLAPQIFYDWAVSRKCDKVISSEKKNGKGRIFP